MPFSPDIAEHLSFFAAPEAAGPGGRAREPRWLAAARSEAEARLRTAGLPNRNDESWKYTDPGMFLKPDGQQSGSPHVVPALMDEAVSVTDDGCKYRFSGRELLESQGVTVHCLLDTPNSGGGGACGLFGKLEAAAHEIVPRGIAAVNTSRSERGLIIECRPESRAAIQLSHRPGIQSAGLITHHVIDVQPESELLLAESGTDAAWSNVVYEIRVGKGASFHFVRASGGADGSSAGVCSVFTDVEEGGRINLFGMSAWSPWVRNECFVRLKGDRAKANLAGAVLGGKGCHHDDTVMIIHEGESCESRQVYKKVLRQGARGVFQGKILVRPGAQKTDGYQISQGLLLDDDSQFLAKPELEIYADDVACSHGSTSGGVDETAMFYLRSRGIKEPEAQELVALAFLAEAVSEVEDDQIRSRLTGLASDWVSGSG